MDWQSVMTLCITLHENIVEDLRLLNSRLNRHIDKLCISCVETMLDDVVRRCDLTSEAIQVKRFYRGRSEHRLCVAMASSSPTSGVASVQKIELPELEAQAFSSASVESQAARTVLYVDNDRMEDFSGLDVASERNHFEADDSGIHDETSHCDKKSDVLEISIPKEVDFSPFLGRDGQNASTKETPFRSVALSAEPGETSDIRALPETPSKIYRGVSSGETNCFVKNELLSGQDGDITKGFPGYQSSAGSPPISASHFRVSEIEILSSANDESSSLCHSDRAESTDRVVASDDGIPIIYVPDKDEDIYNIYGILSNESSNTVPASSFISRSISSKKDGKLSEKVQKSMIPVLVPSSSFKTPRKRGLSFTDSKSSSVVSTLEKGPGSDQMETRSRLQSGKTTVTPLIRPLPTHQLSYASSVDVGFSRMHGSKSVQPKRRKILSGSHSQNFSLTKLLESARELISENSRKEDASPHCLEDERENHELSQTCRMEERATGSDQNHMPVTQDCEPSRDCNTLKQKERFRNSSSDGEHLCSPVRDRSRESDSDRSRCRRSFSSRCPRMTPTRNFSWEYYHRLFGNRKMRELQEDVERVNGVERAKEKMGRLLCRFKDCKNEGCYYRHPERKTTFRKAVEKEMARMENEERKSRARDYSDKTSGKASGRK